ncbi:MAG: right-handed parallel beta-helix repeat-containing protein [Salinibacter sp.]
MDHFSAPRIVIIALGLVAQACLAGPLQAREYHVSVEGSNAYDGTQEKPLRTISAAAERAQPGDIVIVHEGTYRERIDPPRGGTSDQQRIVYRAARDAKVVIKGSEVVEDWQRVKENVWKANIPNRLFGETNPYRQKIQGHWFHPEGREHHTGAVYFNGKWLREAATRQEVFKAEKDAEKWYARVREQRTVIWARFEGNPLQHQVEINVRPAVFYPDRPGIDYITVRGFTMRHAATPWAPPTSEQIGLIGTHWSKGWVIENNVISHSRSTGLTLGKYEDSLNEEESAAGYNNTIDHARENGWSKENIGHHVVRNNRISHCGQAGIVGSMGGAFSRIEGNVIHDIYQRRAFSGYEMAGIKLHGAIDTVIKDNHIFRAFRGIWLDWMSQGTRMTGNLLYANDRMDLFSEVNHGPYVIDNNIFLSDTALMDRSQGGAFAHNLFAGDIQQKPETTRATPFHEPHSTRIAGRTHIDGGDNRFYNNLFVASADLDAYDDVGRPMHMGGNVFLAGATPAASAQNPIVANDFEPSLDLIEKSGALQLKVRVDSAWKQDRQRKRVDTELLGNAEVTNLPYEQPDGSALQIDADYVGQRRDASNPFPGPFVLPKVEDGIVNVWPK